MTQQKVTYQRWRNGKLETRTFRPKSLLVADKVMSWIGFYRPESDSLFTEERTSGELLR